MVSRSLRLVTLLGSVGLRDHDGPRPDTFEPFIEDGPRVVPLELLVLPSHVHLKVCVKYVLVLIMKGHSDQKLEKRHN